MVQDDPSSGGAVPPDSEKRAAIDASLEAIRDRYTNPGLRFQEINAAYAAYGEIYPLETFPPLLEKKALELGLALFPSRYDLRARLDQVEAALERSWPLFAYRNRTVAVDCSAVALDGVESAILAIADPATRCARALAAFMKYMQVGRPEHYPAALNDFALSHLAGETKRRLCGPGTGGAGPGGADALKHFVVTRLGLGVRHQPWYDATLSLFEAVTFPSMRAQTSQEFTWLVIVDRHIPEPARRRLANIVARMPNLHVVPLDMTGMRYVRHGSFDHVWECCQEYILAHRLLTDPTEYVITSLIDGDDALHRQALELARGHLEPERDRLERQEADRSTVIRHTCGQVLTFPRGLRWFAQADIVQPLDYDFLGMGVFVLTRFSSGTSVLACDHAHWPAMAYVLYFDVKRAEPDRPMWIYVRHDRTQVDWRVEVAGTDPESAAILRTAFGIDFEKLAQWRADAARQLPQGRPDRHDGMSGREQNDCCFRLAALNRQIAALERKRQQLGTDDEDEALLIRQRKERLRLLDRFEQGGQQFFR